MDRPHIQRVIDALSPVDLSALTFTATAFRHFPNNLAPTRYVVSVEVKVVSTGQTFAFDSLVPLAVGDGKTKEEVLQWLWDQPETQLKARTLQKQYVDTQAAIAARGGQPVPLPPGDVTGKPFVPVSE